VCKSLVAREKVPIGIANSQTFFVSFQGAWGVVCWVDGKRKVLNVFTISLERFFNYLELCIHNWTNALAIGKEEFTDPDLSRKRFVIHEDRIFIEELKIRDALVNGVSNCFSIFLVICNVIVPKIRELSWMLLRAGERH